MLVDRGAQMNIPDTKFGRTPLHWAAYEGHGTTSETLLKRGADPSVIDHNGETALQTAQRRGHAKVVQALSEH